MSATPGWMPTISWPTASRFRRSPSTTTWGLGAGIGIYFGGGVRGDLTYEWLASTDVHATGVAVADFELNTQVPLANL